LAADLGLSTIGDLSKEISDCAGLARGRLVRVPERAGIVALGGRVTVVDRSDAPAHREDRGVIGGPAGTLR